MTEQNLDLAWKSCKRVRLLAQPVGLGTPLTIAGGYLLWNMILAFSLEEPLWLQLSTVMLIIGFGFMFLLGVNYLLTPFERIWVRPGEAQLRLGKLVLRRIPEAQIHSVGATTREIMVRNRDVDLYRIRLRCEKGWPKHIWIDWTVETEELLRETLTNTLFLM